ncbi:hypothetical protein BDR04DRAFT_743528 [Suillus decipiens]|nr:hypothetical protein BDR04DRAFT_743528 [Suillus decipiens]
MICCIGMSCSFTFGGDLHGMKARIKSFWPGVLLLRTSSTIVSLGFCDSVLGRFVGTDVKFHGKPKRPIMAKLCHVDLFHHKGVDYIVFYH